MVNTVFGETGTDLRSFLHRSSANSPKFGVNPANTDQTYSIKSNSQWATRLLLLGLPGVVNDRLMVLRECLISTDNE